MSVEPQDLLEWAGDTLEHRETAEACRRACASRAYYAAYHSVKWIGDQLPPAPDTRGGVHDQLCWQLQQAPRPESLENDHLTIRSLGYILQQQKDVRVRADYRLSEDFIDSDADEAVRRAVQVLDKVANLSVNSSGHSESG